MSYLLTWTDCRLILRGLDWVAVTRWAAGEMRALGSIAIAR